MRRPVYTFIVTLCLLLAVLPAFSQINYTLQKALQSAKTSNPVLKTEIINISIAETDIITAKLRPNPVLNNQSLQLLQPSYFPKNTVWSDGKNRQVWWQLTKQFQLPAQRKYKIDFATQKVALTQKQYDETERNLFQEVALKWLDAWTARKQLDVLLLAKKTTDTLVVINKFRLKNKLINQTELSRTELLANQYALQISSAEQNYANELLGLKFLIGAADNLSIDTTDNFNYTLPANLDTLLQQALTTRSDVLILKSDIDASNSHIKLQRSLAWPTPELGAIYNPQNTIPYAGFFGTLQIPIFSRNQGEIKKSNLVKQQAEQGLIAVRQKIQTEISIAYGTYQIQKQNVLGLRDILKQSEVIVNNLKHSYLANEAPLTDLIDGQRNWLDTQQSYYHALQQYRLSYIKLLFNSGLISKLAQ